MLNMPRIAKQWEIIHGYIAINRIYQTFDSEIFQILEKYSNSDIEEGKMQVFSQSQLV